MAAAPSKQTQRLQTYLKALHDNPLPFLKNLSLETDESINKLSGILLGPDGTPYEGGHFRFRVVFPPEYPFVPPEFYFVTAICHPNILSNEGLTCNDHLSATWSPRITLREYLTEIQKLLQTPNYDVPIEGDTLHDKSPEKARVWTDEFAKP